MRLIRATTIAVAATAATFTLAVVVLPLAGAAATCHGLEATHVGVAGLPLDGTSGPDVMVTNGSQWVNGREGDDHICVTGGAWTSVDAGKGHDHVDASRHQGPRVGTMLKSGDDEYVGSSQRDSVHAGGGWHTGDDVINTGAGPDIVLVYESADRTRLDLGRGRDRVRIYGQKTDFRIYGGAGRDRVNIRCECPTMMPFLDLDLGRGNYAISRGAGKLKGFEDTLVMGVDRASITGSEWGNSIRLNVCRPEVHGRAGPDEISYGDIGPWCAQPRMTFFGEGGNDSLLGGPGADHLAGGAGVDRAAGYRGVDLCRAERRTGCET